MEYADKTQTTFQAMLRRYAISWQGIELPCHTHTYTHKHSLIVAVSGILRGGGFGVFKPPPKIPKISVE